MKMRERRGLGRQGLIQFEDFNKICRLCCKMSDTLAPIYNKKEKSDDNLVDNDSDSAIVIMLLKIGLNVIMIQKPHTE